MLLPLLAASLVVTASTAVAITDAGRTTAGSRDQRGSHLPTIIALARALPHVDVASIDVATGPLFHVLVAVPVRLLGLSAVGAQVAGSALAACCAVLVLTSSRTVASPATRALLAAPLMLSAYFWQSALWLNTDDTALLFGLTSLLLALRDRRLLTCTLVGLLLACAVATRQSWVWLLPPTTVAVLLPWAPRRSTSLRLVAVCAPPTVVLAFLLVSWGGLTPPAFQGGNATPPSAISVSYTAALSASFLLPLALSATSSGRPWLGRAGIAAGLVAALPAALSPSEATITSNARAGGWLWEVVRLAPGLGGRSPLLIALAFLGGVTLVQVTHQVDRRVRWVVVVGVLSLALTLTPGVNLYQRYTEVPLLLLALVLSREVCRRRALARRWPLVLVGLGQAAVLSVVVLVPLAHDWWPPG